MIRGTNHDQDARFVDKTKKMLENSKWPDKYDIKIDLSKVDMQLIKKWIEQKIQKLLGQEDDIISGTITGILQQNMQKQQKLNAKQFHIAITGLLQDKTLLFVSQLWDILDEAQHSSRGIPQCLLQQKKKTEQNQRKRLQELKNKRYKIDSQKFSRTINRLTNNRDSHRRFQEKDRKIEQDRSRSSDGRANRKKQDNFKKKKHRSRSRSYRRNKQRKRQKDRKSQRKSHKKQKQRRQKKEGKRGRERSESRGSSQSSDVISSSSSQQN